MKKGFTLIELLAVIVILAIIALIATPIILGIINNASLQSKERTSELIGDAVVNAYTSYALKNPAANSSSFCEYMKTEFTMDNASVKDCSNNIAMVKSGNDEYQVKYENGKAYVTHEGLDKVVEVVLTSTSKPVEESPEDWFTYTDNGDGTLTVTGFSDEWDGTLDISLPSKYDGKPVTIIEDAAFFNKGLTSVVISNGITYIGYNAFAWNNLTNIIITDYSNLEIYQGAFAVDDRSNPNLLDSLSDEAKQNILNACVRGYNAFTIDVGE